MPSVARMVRVAHEPTTTIDSGPNAQTNDPTPTFTFSSQPGTSFECKLDSGSYAPCGSPKTTPLPRRRLPYLLRPRQRLGGERRPDAGLPHLHRQDRRGQRLGSILVVTAATGAKDNLAITRPSASTLRVTDLAGGVLHRLRRPHGARVHPKRRLHRQLQRGRDHPDPGLLRGSNRQGGQLDHDPELAQRGRGRTTS